MRLLKSWFCLTLVMLALVGCASTEEKVDGAADGTAVDGNDTATSGYDGSGLSGSEINGTGPGTIMDGSLMGSNAALMGGDFADPNHPLSVQVIYFMFDSSQVRPEFTKIIDAHSQYLAAHPDQRVALEGHADERGSPEYNIALSEQRAKAVSRTMQRQGVSGSQLELVSYGEEKPAAFDHNESSWHLNRRVEIVYKAR
jgi:peptidoglycan-associated lipoprotein